MSELSKRYRISKAALYRIKHDFRLIKNSETTRKIFKFGCGEEEIVTKCVQEFLDSQTWQFNAKDLSKYILLKLRRSFPLNKIKELMKEKFNLSYKRINSRPCYIDEDRLQLTRILFSMSLSNTIDHETLLINIDETMITKETKSNYSWAPKGINSEILNIKFENSLNIILAICSNGSWFEMLSNNTLTADRFIIFLRNLKAFLKDNNNFEFKKILIIVDNLPSHRTNKVISMLLDCGFDICFLPPYSPSLAPVELTFGVLKQKLIQNRIGKWVNLKNYEGYNLVVMCMKEIDAKVIHNWFSHFYWEIKANLSKISYYN